MSRTAERSTGARVTAGRRLVIALASVVVAGSAATVVLGTDPAFATAPKTVPSVTGVAPDTGSTEGGTSVTISGTQLGKATAVEFGSTPATQFSVKSSTTIYATAPAGDAGTVDITVTTPSGPTAPNPSDAFTYVDADPGTVSIVPQYSDRNCAGNVDTATWVPPSGVQGLDGYRLVLEQVTSSGPTFHTYDVGPDTTSHHLTLINGQNDVLVYAVTAAGVAKTPFGTASLTGYGIPMPMAWDESGQNAVSDGSASVTFSWAGPITNSTTGGDVAGDTVEIASSAGGSQSVPASTSGVTGTFSGLTDGTGYVFTDTVSDVCGTSTTSEDSPTFVPGVVPTISGDPSGGAVGTPYSFSYTVGGDPGPTVSLSSGELPPGLELSADGTISGTPTQGGEYSGTVTASNGVGIQEIEDTDATVQFTIDVDQAPSITSASSTLFAVGRQKTFEVTTSGFPVPDVLESGTLPDGLEFVVQSGGTATITGTAAAGANGIYPVTITASNGVGDDASQTFSLVVGPVITSPDFVTSGAGAPFSMTVTTAGKGPVTIYESGKLPKGVTFEDNGDGTATFAGTPGASSGGSYTVTLRATFGKGAEMQSVTQQLTIDIDEPLSFGGPTKAKAYVGYSLDFTIESKGFPAATQITESGSLPHGITFSYTGGTAATLTGTPQPGTAGDYTINVEASNDAGQTATETIVVVVKQPDS